VRLLWLFICNGLFQCVSYFIATNFAKELILPIGVGLFVEGTMKKGFIEGSVASGQCARDKENSLSLSLVKEKRRLF
jgi:hypothetical protein